MPAKKSPKTGRIHSLWPAAYTRVASIIAASFIFSVATAGAGEPNLTLRISNDTENTIEHLFVRQSGNRLFGGDTLSVAGELDPDDSVSVGLESSFTESLYEVKAIDSDSTVYRVDTIRVGSGADSNTATISPEQATGAEAPELGSATVFASMETDVFYVYLERIDTQDLGANLTGGTMIPEDGAEEIRYIASEAEQLGSFIIVDSIGATMRVDGPGD